MKKISLKTQKHSQFIDITRQVQGAVDGCGVLDGVCTVFVPHTTAGLTINENADPDVVADILGSLKKLVPWKADYAHAEGNSAAHIKAGLLGFSQSIIVQGGKLQLGTWQGIYFAEFDGPRSREIWVTVK